MTACKAETIDVSFMVYNYSTTGIREAYINDKVLQQVSNQLEVGKAEYFYSKIFFLNALGVIPFFFKKTRLK